MALSASVFQVRGSVKLLEDKIKTSVAESMQNMYYDRTYIGFEKCSRLCKESASMMFTNNEVTKQYNTWKTTSSTNWPS